MCGNHSQVNFQVLGEAGRLPPDRGAENNTDFLSVVRSPGNPEEWAAPSIQVSQEGRGFSSGA